MSDTNCNYDTELDAFASVEPVEIIKEMKNHPDRSIYSIMNISEDQQRQLELCSLLRSLRLKSWCEHIVEVPCIPASKLSLCRLNQTYRLSSSEYKEAQDVIVAQGVFILVLFKLGCTFDSSSVMWYFRSKLDSQVDAAKVQIIVRYEDIGMTCLRDVNVC